jgi:FSR family fosmidomycin resistance protein-like MFS transporter
MLAARFLDEWWGGLIIVLLPLIRDDLGLTYAQVSVLLASFGWAGWVADPVTGLVSDVWPRRPIISLSALGVGLVLFALGGAISFEVMLLVCVGFSIGVTPLAVIADAVLVDSHPDAPGRIMARQTLIDTFGAMLAPLTATFLTAVGVPWPKAFLVGGVMFAIYAFLLWQTHFLPTVTTPSGKAAVDDGPAGLRAMWRNLKAVSRERDVWGWLVFLTLNDFMTDVTLGFLPLFLADVIGLDESWIGLYYAAGMLAQVAGLALVEPLLARWQERQVLRTAILGVMILFPLLMFGGHPLLVLALLMAYSLFVSVIWPLAKGQLLTAADGRTATVKALGPLTDLPTSVMPLLVGAVAGVAGLRSGLLMLAFAPPLMLVVLRGMNRKNA